MMQFDSRLLQPLDHLQPFRPVWIDQDIAIVCLNEKRGVPDPGDAKFAWPNCGKTRDCAFAGAFSKEGRDEDLGQKVPPMPVDSWLQGYARRGFILRAVVGRLPYHPRFF